MTGPTSFSVGGTLGGDGTINTSSITINNGGAVSPGGIVANVNGAVTNTVATLNGANLTVASGGTYAVDIGSFSDVTNVDLLNVTGAAAMNSGSILALNNLAGTEPTDGMTRQYIIASGGSPASASGVTIVPTGFAAGDTFSLQAVGNNLVLSFTPVPEPVATLAIFAAGLGAVGAVRPEASSLSYGCITFCKNRPSTLLTSPSWLSSHLGFLFSPSSNDASLYRNCISVTAVAAPGTRTPGEGRSNRCRQYPVMPRRVAFTGLTAPERMLVYPPNSNSVFVCPGGIDEASVPPAVFQALGRNRPKPRRVDYRRRVQAWLVTFARFQERF